MTDNSNKRFKYIGQLRSTGDSLINKIRFKDYAIMSLAETPIYLGIIILLMYTTEWFKHLYTKVIWSTLIIVCGVFLLILIPYVYIHFTIRPARPKMIEYHPSKKILIYYLILGFVLVLGMGTSIWGCVTSNHAYILGSYAITLLTCFTSLGLGIHTDDHILALGGFTIPLLLLMLPPCIAIIIKMVL